MELIEAVWALCRERRYERPELLIDIADQALAAAGRSDDAHEAFARARRSNADAGLALWVRLCGDERLAPTRMAG